MSNLINSLSIWVKKSYKLVNRIIIEKKIGGTEQNPEYLLRAREDLIN
jgi:hypothetical protein